MKNSIQILLIFVFSLGINQGHGQSKNFESFKKNFIEVKFPLILDNTPQQIDSALFIKEFSRSEYLRYLNSIPEFTSGEYYFYYGGKTHFKNFDVLIYRMTRFGEAPALDTVKIELAVFGQKGEMVSKMIIAGMETDDRDINCQVNGDLIFEVTITNSNTLISRKKYCINDKGKIAAINF